MDAIYQEFFVDRADSRVATWPLMKDPLGITILLTFYLYMIYSFLPKYMKDRKPYNLKLFIQLYNTFQIVICSIIVYRLWSLMSIDFLFCKEVDYSDDENALKMLDTFYIIFCTKIADLIETFFFALRKKQNQITNLHVYHHVSTLTVLWVLVKYIGGGMSAFSMILNCGIHVIMYSYYFLAALGPNVAKKLEIVKSKLTMIQMIQFWMIVIHSTQVFQEDCGMPNIAAYAIIPNVLVIFGFFLNFYIQKYRKNK